MERRSKDRREADMPGSLENIRHMWEKAEAGEKESFLFDALIVLQNTFCRKIDIVNRSIDDMTTRCECRQKDCDKIYVSRSQAKLFGIILLIFAVGLAVGTGYLTVKEIMGYHLPI